MGTLNARPNLLVIMSDEHAPIFSGTYGHPLVQTPHMAGEHGGWRKSNCDEQSARIPTLPSWPGRLPAGRRVREVVSPVDPVATLEGPAETERQWYRTEARGDPPRQPLA